jgi:hypothetical protein
MNVAAAAPEPPPEPAPEPEPQGEPVMPDIAPVAEPVPAPVAVAAGGPEILPLGGPRITAEAFPYSFDGNGPQMLRDFVLAAEGNEESARRIQRMNLMLADPRAVNAGCVLMAAAARRRIMAAPGETTNQPAIIPPGYRPDLYTPLLAYEAPLWNSVAKAPITDFNPFTVPREASRAGLSGVPADEITPVVPGSITTGLNTVTPQAVSGTYQFSRALVMGSNPAIDMIAMNALDEEWAKDVETRLAAFIVAGATPGAPTYTTGAGYISALRTAMAQFRTRRHAPATAIISATKEWESAVEADDLQGRPLLNWDGSPIINAQGTVGDGLQNASLYGTPVLPQSFGVAAKKTVVLRAQDLIAFATPIMNFRYEATPGAGNTMNPLLLQVSKYSGVAFWIRRAEGVVVLTNADATGLPFDADDDQGAAKAKK